MCVELPFLHICITGRLKAKFLIIRNSYSEASQRKRLHQRQLPVLTPFLCVLYDTKLFHHFLDYQLWRAFFLLFISTKLKTNCTIIVYLTNFATPTYYETLHFRDFTGTKKWLCIPSQESVAVDEVQVSVDSVDTVEGALNDSWEQLDTKPSIRYIISHLGSDTVWLH